MHPHRSGGQTLNKTIDLDPFFRKKFWVITIGLFYLICGLTQVLSLGFIYIMQIGPDTIFFPNTPERRFGYEDEWVI
jgi:hypothetical protein